MLFKLFKSEFKRNKVINMTLLLFVMLSSLLASSALYLTITLYDGVTELINKSDTPHFVQMHAGDVDMNKYNMFNEQSEYIESNQLSKMLNVPGNEIYFNNAIESEAKSVMDVSLVKQNKEFDYLLDMDNEIAEIGRGEIGVPIFYMRDKELSVGDTFMMKHNGINTEFTISTFIRDSQMNPAIVSSKRFLINSEDFDALEKLQFDHEYLIEYKLTSLDYLDVFGRDYTDEKMPSVGPMVDITLFKALNAVTDGIVVVILVFVSLTLTVIGILCLRYALLSTVEEDIREIGVLKAIGIHHRKIQFIYMAKYIVLTSIACLLGYGLSFVTNGVLVQNITEYMGAISLGLAAVIMPFVGVTLIFLLTIFSIWIILKRLKKITIVEALVSYNTTKKSLFIPRMKLSKIKAINTNIYQGINKVSTNFRSHMLIIVIFILSIFIMLVPVNMFTTMSSSFFIKYMGIGESDLRLDVRQFDESNEELISLLDYVDKDEDISNYGIFKTYTMKVFDDEGEIINLALEVGDADHFPLDYLEGRAPKENEISLSVLSARSVDKIVGDSVNIINSTGEVEVVISGIYQDITNGGKTAKAFTQLSDGDVLWYVINMNLKDGINIKEKSSSYASQFTNIKVTDIDEYVDQTLGSTIKQLKLVAIISSLIAVAIGVLITGLFLKMMLAKESREIAILRSIGFSQKNIRVQYMTRILIVLIIGILSGTLLASTFGQSLLGVVSGAFGATAITFVVNPLLVYIVLPALLCLSVMFTSWVSINQNKISSISNKLME